MDDVIKERSTTIVDLRAISRIITQRTTQLHPDLSTHPIEKVFFAAFCRIDDITTTPLGALQFSLSDVHGQHTLFVIPPVDKDDVDNGDGLESFGWSRVPDQPLPPGGLYGLYICSAVDHFVCFQPFDDIAGPHHTLLWSFDIYQVGNDETPS